MSARQQPSLPHGHDGLAQAIGLEILEMADGEARARVPVSPTILQPMGLVNGAVHSVIAETLCSAATAEAVAGDEMLAMGQSNSATFMRPITSGAVNAHARARHRGRTSWIWDVDLSDDQGRLCAAVRMIVAVRPARSAK